jgi:hypothetical protein
MAKFTNIGYVSETKKSKDGQSEKTYMLNIKPDDKGLASIELPAGAKIMLRAPKQGPKQSEEDFAKIAEWKLFTATLIEDDAE